MEKESARGKKSRGRRGGTGKGPEGMRKEREKGQIVERETVE